MQRFYLEHKCVEHVMNYEQVCALLGALNSKLKEAAQNNKDVAILFTCAANLEDSCINENVLTTRTLVPITVELVEKHSSILKYTDCDDFGLVQEYFNT